MICLLIPMRVVIHFKGYVNFLLVPCAIGGLLLFPSGSTPLVGEVSDYLKMSWIGTASLMTEMINLFLAGDIAVVMCRYDDMHCDCLTIEGHATVAPTTAISGSWSFPEMAG